MKQWIKIFGLVQLVLAGSAVLAVADVTFTNLMVAQRPGTKLVDITYDLISDLTNAVPISLKVKNGTTNVTSTNCTGDVGANVLPGAGKQMVWNMGTDWKTNSASLIYSVMHTTATNLFASVAAPSDSRNYTLAVSSTHGTPAPALGTNMYALGTVVTCSVPSAVVEQGINWRTTGWSGTGSVPASGSTNTTGSMVLTNLSSSITWSWVPASNFAITNLVVVQRPGTKLMDITYDILSDLTNAVPISLKVKKSTTTLTSTNCTGDVGSNVLPGTGKQMVWNMGTDWNTNSASLTYLVLHTTVTNLFASTTAFSDSRNYTLAVSSAYGTPAPTFGANLYALGSVVTCSIPSSVVDQGINWRVTGWSGTGAVPASGSTNTTDSIVLTNLNSSITWNWQSSAAITNVVVAQCPGAKFVDITYDLISDLTNAVSISLKVKNGATNGISANCTGSVGTNVLPGIGREIFWNAGADWNGNLADLSFILTIGVTEPSGMVVIPAGTNSGTDPAFGAYSLTMPNRFYMDTTEVTKAQWDDVKTWALTNGYSFVNPGLGQTNNHPVQSVNWYDCVKWCNARSQKEGRKPCYLIDGVVYKTGELPAVACNASANGYRLPTIAEWEYAARGGLSSKRFPWGDTITHSQANYRSTNTISYDISPTRGYHPIYGAATAPVGSFSANGFGLYDMTGNVWEWCWDLTGANRCNRGGGWDNTAGDAQCSWPGWGTPNGGAPKSLGFRTVCRSEFIIPNSITGTVDTRDYQLIVLSERGTPTPGVGTNLYAWRATVTCSVDSAVTSGLTNWTSAGWSGSGSVSVEGATADTGSFVLTGLVSSIVWNWNTNYWMETVTSGEGQVTGGNRWIAQGSNVSVSANLSAGWLFMGWSGDASGDYTATNIIIPIVRPVSITATFSDDADGDGLLNTTEATLGTDPRKKDTDGDGMSDPQELIAGTSPTNRASVLAVQLSTASSANQVSWYGVSGRYYRLEYTDDLANGWTPKGAVSSGANAQIMTLDIPGGGKRFYRIRVSDSPSGL